MKLPVYKLPSKSKKKDFFYNMLGSTVNAGVSVVLLIVVSHLLGADAAGIFTLAYSTAQMMITVGTFEMRNIQVTDARHEFRFSALLGYRLLTVLLMWASTGVFILIRGYTGTKAVLVAMMCAYMSFLALADVFQGNLHLNGYLFIAMRSLGMTVILAAVAFSVTLALTRNLIISAIPMVMVPILHTIFSDIPYSRNFSGVRPSFRGKELKAIFLCAIPLFLSSFLSQYIFNAPKYAIDSILTSADQANYGYLVMPAFVINLLSLFAFRPRLVSLSEDWVSGNFKSYKKTALRLYLWIVCIAVVTLGGGYLLGIPILNWLYGAHLNDLRGAFMILLLAGCFGACCTLTLTLFTTMRKQKICLVGYGITAIFALIVPRLLVGRFDIVGAAFSYLLEMALLFTSMIIPFVISFSVAKNRFAAKKA